MSAVVVTWGITSGRLESDVASFAGLEADRELAPVVKRLATSELARSVVIVVERLDGSGAIDRRASMEDTSALANRLAAHEEVAWVRAGPDPQMRESIHALYWPRRIAMREDDPEAIDDAFTDEGLDVAASTLVEALRGPTSAFVSRLAPDDPFLAYPKLLRRFERAAAGTLEVSDGTFVTAHGAGVILLASRGSPFDRARQAPLEAALEAAIAEQAAAAPGRLVVRRSGVGRFAVAAETSIRAESTRLSMLGLVGVLVTLLLAFGRLREPLLTILPLALALLVGAAATILVFGHVHALTLGFGGMLVGVVVDYPVHLVVHEAARRTREAPMARSSLGVAPSVSTGIFLGAATTVVGFAGLAGTSYPGLRELATFASTGVIVAVGVTLLVLPHWLVSNGVVPDATEVGPRRRGAMAARGLSWALARARRALAKARAGQAARVTSALLLVAAASFVATVAPGVEFVDDADALSRVSPTHLLEDHLVRGVVGRFDAGRFVVVQAETMEEALVRNDEVARRLDAAVAEGSLTEFRTLHTFLWSEALQRRNLDAFASAREAGLAAKLRDAFDAAGLRGDAFVAGLERGATSKGTSTTSNDAAVLRWSDLVESPIATLVKPFVIEGEDGAGVAVIGHLRGVNDVDRLRTSVEAVEGVRLFDRKASMREAWRAHRVQILWVASLGLCAVTLLVFLRHRDLAKTTRAVSPALLAASFTICVRSFVGPPLHLLDVVAALLVLSMGADYGVFLVESASAEASPGGVEGPPSAGEGAAGEGAADEEAWEQEAATLVAMLLASLTTVWGFGTLALATNPAMQAIGLTTGIGVAAALIFAILVHVAGAPRSRARTAAGATPQKALAHAGRGLALALAIGTAGVALGCAGGGRATTPSSASGRSTRAPVVDPASLPFDAALRQSVTASRRGESHTMDVAVEIDESRVVMVGVLPFGGRIFTLVATREGIEETVHLPGRVPVEATPMYLDLARALLVDAARVWSGDAPRGVGGGLGGGAAARRRGRSPFGRYVDVWRHGCLVERRYSGDDPLVIHYVDPWCRGGLPRHVRLEHPRLELVIDVETIAGQATPRAR